MSVQRSLCGLVSGRLCLDSWWFHLTSPSVFITLVFLCSSSRPRHRWARHQRTVWGGHDSPGSADPAGTFGDSEENVCCGFLITAFSDIRVDDVGSGGECNESCSV